MGPAMRPDDAAELYVVLVAAAIQLCAAVGLTDERQLDELLDTLTHVDPYDVLNAHRWPT